MRVASGDIHLVPPTETNQATTGDVFEIVEIRGEKEQGQDEDEDTVTALACEHSRRDVSKQTYKSLMKRTPNKYIRRAPMRKPRKQTRVMGWALRRQFRSPCCGCGGSMIEWTPEKINRSIEERQHTHTLSLSLYETSSGR